MIIVTGGAGFIGRHLCKRLESEGEKVFVLDNFSRGQEHTKFNLENAADITSMADTESTFEYAAGIEPISEVIHLAFINGTPNFYNMPSKVMYVATTGLWNILLMCEQFKVPRFTLLSSSEVCRYMPIHSSESQPLMIPDPYNARYSYAVGKIINEMMTIHWRTPFERLLIVRPFNIYGPGMSRGHVVPDLIVQFEQDDTREPIEVKVIGSGDETRSFCFIDDLIDGLMIARAKGKHREIYNIGNPQETTIKHLAEMIGAILKKRFWLQFNDQWREGDLPRRRPDISKLAALGYTPKWSLWAGLSATIERKTGCLSSD